MACHSGYRCHVVTSFLRKSHDYATFLLVHASGFEMNKPHSSIRNAPCEMALKVRGDEKMP
jgi:hypothetical protein